MIQKTIKSNYNRQLIQFEMNICYCLFTFLFLSLPIPILAQNIDIADSTKLIGAPNVFSPNGDLNNDVFTLNLRDCTLLKLEIFNRWGNKVFDSKNQLTNQWDGKQDEKDCPSGVYFWAAQVVCEVDNKIEAYKGNVTLVR